MSNLGMKVTVEFVCDNMVDEDEFKKVFKSDPELCYRYISCDGEDHVMNFSRGFGKIINIKMIEE